MKEKVGFIGLGLIGGSLAKAIRTYFPDYEIVAFDKNKEARDTMPCLSFSVSVLALSVTCGDTSPKGRGFCSRSG